MKNIWIILLLFIVCNTGQAQDVFGYWEGIITAGKEQFKFEINITEGDPTDPVVLHCRACPKLKGDIIDHRNLEKPIHFYGIINADRSINLVDSIIVFKQKYEGEVRTRYQVHVEMKGGEPWLVGYYQDYNNKGREVKRGRIYLKRMKPAETKA